MNMLQEARKVLEESIALAPGNYRAIKQLLPTLTKLGDKNAALDLMRHLVRLDPHNPTVFDDCILYARGSQINWADLLQLLEALRTDYSDDKLIQANCDFYAAKVTLNNDPAFARKRLLAAKALFRQVLPPGHHVFAALRSAFRELSRMGRPIPPSRS